MERKFLRQWKDKLILGVEGNILQGKKNKEQVAFSNGKVEGSNLQRQGRKKIFKEFDQPSPVTCQSVQLETSLHFLAGIDK
jgi:hypothetical protein